MGIFKKKPGGTMFGNLVRTVAQKYTGGILGGGAMLMKEPDSSPAPRTPIFNMDAVKNMGMDVVSTAIDQNPPIKKAIAKGIWVKYKAYIIAAAVALVTLLFFAFKPKHSHIKRRF